MDLSNGAIADALEELGDLYELDGAIVHRVLAYRTAAKAVREASVSVSALAREGRASELPGIGKTLQEKILALVATGTIPAAEKLRAKFPKGLIEITRLPGIGPKRARLLHSQLQIDSLAGAARGGARPARARGAGFGAEVRAGGARRACASGGTPGRAGIGATLAPARARARRGARAGARAEQRRRGRGRARGGVGAQDGRQRQGHRPDRGDEQAAGARQEPRGARADRAGRLREPLGREGSQPFGLGRRSAHRQTGPAGKPVAALHRLGQAQRGLARTGGAARSARLRARRQPRRERTRAHVRERGRVV